jgi:hypothetical protein
MKKIFASFALALAFLAGAMVSAQVRDLQDLESIHQHIIDSIHDMERARAENHYDMQGHGVKAEEHLKAAEHELDLALRAARRR